MKKNIFYHEKNISPREDNSELRNFLQSKNQVQ